MKVGKAHLIRETTLEFLETEIRRLHHECERLQTASQLRVVHAEPPLEGADPQEVRRELTELWGEHRQQMARIAQEHRVRLAHAVAEAEVSAKRLRRAGEAPAAPGTAAGAEPKKIPPVEPPAQPIFLPHSQLAHQLLDGLEGLEIGAGAHSPWGLRTKNVGLTPEMDPEDFEMCKQYQIAFCGTWAQVDVAGDAERIPVSDDSQDFVVHAHVWEHLSNPLRGLREWARVVKPGGIIFAIVPKRDTVSSDCALPITPLWEHVFHYLNDSHYEDRVNYADPSRYPGRGSHISRFTLEALQDIGAWFNWHFHGPRLEEIAALETDDKVGNGHCIVWRVHKHH